MKFYFIFFITIIGNLAFGQVTNDNCNTAIDLGTVSNFCSANGNYANIGSTTTPNVPCARNNLRDVWFKFIPTENQASITIIGDKEEGGGGTLKRPDVAVFGGTCDLLLSVSCQFTTENFGLLRLTGLSTSDAYYIRVGSLPENTGTFQLCINDFLIDVDESSDCYPARRVCKNDPISIDSLSISVDVGSRDLNNCLGDFSEGKRAKWFVWSIQNAGELTFNITPKNNNDNIDFAIFRLLQDTSNCLDNAVLIRCMGSGPTNLNAVGCLGPIGLRTGSSDENELRGCSDGYDNYLKSLTVEQGDRFSMVVVNQSSNEGFDLVFGNNIEFASPEFSLESDMDGFCNGDNAIISLTDEAFLNENNIETWEWDFGASGVPGLSSTQGPHSVNWSEPGEKEILARFITTDGCEVDASMMLTVIPCCDPQNPLLPSIELSAATCSFMANGAASLEVEGGNGPYNVLWEDGNESFSRLDLSKGSYSISITDQAECDTVLLIEVMAPDSILVAPDIISPECGEDNGAISLGISGGVGEYDIQWDVNESFVNERTRSSLQPSVYQITVRDANLCEIPSWIDLTTASILSIDSTASVLDGPRCFGDRNGDFLLRMKGGTEPYAFDYNDGNGFGSSRRFEAFSDTSFNVVIRDGEGCLERFDIYFDEPDSLRFDSTRIMGFECHDDVVGAVGLYVSGGTKNYEYYMNNIRVSFNDGIRNDIRPDLYMLEVVDANGCQINRPLDLRTPILFDPLDNNSFAMNRGDIINIDIPLESGSKIEWITSSENSCNDCSDPVLTPRETTTYRYMVTNSIGCTSTHSLEVAVDPRLPVYIPNAISPNQDGINDELKLYPGEGVKEVRYLRIFDRWGNLLFYADSPELLKNGWDGIYKGRNVNMGTYVYVAEIEMSNGQIEILSGNFSVVK